MNSETRRRRKQLERLDLKRAEYTYVKTVVKSLFNGQVAPALKIDAGGAFYRVRKNPPRKPSKLIEIREPPWEFVTGFQRCNSPGKPVFYASNRILTAALETNVVDGDTVYMSQWFLTKPMRCNVAVMSELYDEHKEIDEILTSASIELIEYFETLFTRPVHDTFSEQYKTTAAISEMLTGEFSRALISPEVDDAFLSSDGHMGLAYKSVVDRAEGENLALHPTLVTEFCSIGNVIEARIISRSDSDIVLEVLDFSDTVTDGVLSWSNDPRSIPFLDFSNGGSINYEGMKWIAKGDA